MLTRPHAPALSERFRKISAPTRLQTDVLDRSGQGRGDKTSSRLRFGPRQDDPSPFTKNLNAILDFDWPVCVRNLPVSFDAGLHHLRRHTPQIASIFTWRNAHNLTKHLREMGMAGKSTHGGDVNQRRALLMHELLRAFKAQPQKIAMRCAAG